MQYDLLMSTSQAVSWAALHQHHVMSPYQRNKHQNNLWSKQPLSTCGGDVSFEHTALCIADQYRWFGLRRFDNVLMGHKVPFSAGRRSASLIRQSVLVLRLDWGTVTDLCVFECSLRWSQHLFFSVWCSTQLLLWGEPCLLSHCLLSQPHGWMTAMQYYCDYYYIVVLL